ncbi:hypothetical protein Mal15_33180 [Stieleria maiorica]|uniref:Uncharacterized protein n=1 Tax=Stieleria maiorica TaxID=2795974 RepID=A0A5B9MGL5_9BACT|nr:hypothetical protein [Stieleria maiorica]QEF99256.1 hypothetical protein Mal15_33180 [Stieleria maiorica]
MFQALRHSLRRKKRPAKQQQRARRKHAHRIESLEKRMLMVANLQAMLTTEHVDLNIASDGEQWSIGPRNSSARPAIQYANDAAAMYVGAPAEMSRPVNAEYDFIGVGPGESFYLLPQHQNPDLLFLGFASGGITDSLDSYDASGESKGRVSAAVGEWIKVALSDVAHTNPDGTIGDGDLSIWQSGVFGDAKVFM